MATEAGDLLVSIKADLTDLKAGLQSANRSVESFSASTVAKGMLVADAIKTMGSEVIKFGWDSLKAYATSEQSVARLEQALKNQGLEVKNTSRDLQAYASELQRTSTVSDEAALDTMQLLTTFGLTGDKMKEATRSALDLSKGLGIDLHSATMLVGKAFVGETGSLSRFGITIKDSIPASQKFEAVLGKINDRFGGAAQADLKTVNGQMANMANRFDDLKEKLGKELLPAFSFWMNQIDSLTKTIEKMTGASEKEAQGRELTIKALQRERDEIINTHKQRQLAMGGVIIMSDAEQRRLILITKSLEREKDMLKDEQKVADKKVDITKKKVNKITDLEEEEQAKKRKARDKEIADIQNDTQTMMGKLQTRADQNLALLTKFNFQEAGLINAHLTDTEQRELLDQVTRLENNKLFDDARLLKQQAVNLAMTKAEDERTKRQVEENKKRQENFTSTLNFISSLATVKNRELAMIGKAASITVATVDTYQAANKALASAPPPWNFALMGAVVAAGLANVARIAGVKMAQGGVVMPKDGGVAATVAEAGSPEAVLPLNNKRSMGMIADAIGGGGRSIVVNISGQFLEADAAKWQRLIRESIVPEVRRYTDISPKGSFIRRRGQS